MYEIQLLNTFEIPSTSNKKLITSNKIRSISIKIPNISNNT